MAQHDFNIANATFPAVRSDINSALTAINTTQSGTSRPSSAVAGTIWLDTTGTPTSNTLKFYDGADDISLATINYTANTVDWLDSSITITGLSTSATGTVLTLSDTATTSTVNLIIDNQKEVRFRETTANGTNYIGLKAPASLSVDLTYTLPTAPASNNRALISSTAGVMSFTPYAFPASDGTANQFLKTDGSGTLSFSAGGGFSGATENAIGSSAITLTSSSNQFQKAQISTLANSYLTLPSATTMNIKGTPVFVIENNSPIGASLDIRNNSGTTIDVIPDNYVGFISLIDNSTTDGKWRISVTKNQAVLEINSTVNSNSPTNSAITKVIHLTSTKLLLANFYKTSATVLTMYTKIGDLSGNTITFGSQQSTTITAPSGTTDGGFKADVVRLSDSAFILMWGTLTAEFGNIRRVSVNTVSGTTITFGTQNALSFPNGSSDLDQAIAGAYNGICCRMADDKFAVVYNTTTVSGSANWLRAYSGSLTCNIITVSGTTLTVGTKVDLGTSTYTMATTLVSHDTDKLCVIYYQHTSGSGNGRNKVNIISVSGTTPTWGTSVNVESADITNVWDRLSIYYAWFSGTIPQATSVNSIYGVVLSTTSVLGIGGGDTGHILISISGTTPTIVANKLITTAYSWHYPPCAINSTTVFQPVASVATATYLGVYIYTSSSGIKISPYMTLTANSQNPFTYSLVYTTPRGTTGSTSFSIFNNSTTNYISTGTFSV